MILTTMILIIAALVIVVIGFVLDRLAIRKLKSGMRALYKRIKKVERRLEKQSNPYNISLCGEDIAKAGRDYISEMNVKEEVNYEAVDPEQEEDVDSTPADQADGEV